ncbi:MAG: glycosyltransferase family 2 protein [Alistipes sp.]|nr:glycosyltransferase family 2 protein [Alistipes sp.]
MAQPLVTIITNTKNRAHLIPRCIESIQRQSYQNYEHIIADGCSTDDTEAVVLSYNDPHIKYIKIEGGPIEQTRAAFSLSKGSYITFLDDDDEYLPEKIEKQLTLILSLPSDYGFIYGSMSYYDSNSGKFLYDHIAQYNGGRELLPIAVASSVICGTPTLMFRRETFESVGGTWLSGIGNDMSDWALVARTINQGWKVAALQESLVRVYVNHSSVRMSEASFYDDRHERCIKFYGHFLTEYADIIKAHPQAAIKHYEGLIFHYVMSRQSSKAWPYYLKLIKVRPNIRSLAMLPYYLYKRVIK